MKALMESIPLILRNMEASDFLPLPCLRVVNETVDQETNNDAKVEEEEEEGDDNEDDNDDEEGEEDEEEEEEEEDEPNHNTLKPIFYCLHSISTPSPNNPLTLSFRLNPLVRIISSDDLGKFTNCVKNKLDSANQVYVVHSSFGNETFESVLRQAVVFPYTMVDHVEALLEVFKEYQLERQGGYGRLGEEKEELGVEKVQNKGERKRLSSSFSSSASSSSSSSPQLSPGIKRKREERDEGTETETAADVGADRGSGRWEARKGRNGGAVDISVAKIEHQMHIAKEAALLQKAKETPGKAKGRRATIMAAMRADSDGGTDRLGLYTPRDSSVNTPRGDRDDVDEGNERVSGGIEPSQTGGSWAVVPSPGPRSAPPSGPPGSSSDPSSESSVTSQASTMLKVADEVDVSHQSGGKHGKYVTVSSILNRMASQITPSKANKGTTEAKEEKVEMEGKKDKKGTDKNATDKKGKDKNGTEKQMSASLVDADVLKMLRVFEAAGALTVMEGR